MTQNKTNDTNIVFKEESYRIIGACMTVHKNLGAGFLESVYSEALEMEFIKEKIPYEKEKKLPIYYNGQQLKKFFVSDFVCFGSIIVELKASNYLADVNFKQALNYLKATKFRLALLVNFGAPSLLYKRILN